MLFFNYIARKEDTMGQRNSSKFSNWMAVLGWIVAFLSLTLNWIVYNDARKQSLAREKEIPTFSFEMATYDTTNLPKEILDLKKEIKHNFVVTHRTGPAVQKLIAEFRSHDAEIIGINIEKGKQGISSKIETGGLEASFIKTKLLPSQSIRGYVTTRGITNLEFVLDAEVGEEFKESLTNEAVEPAVLDQNTVLAIVFLIIMAGVVIILIYMALPTLRESGFVGELKKNTANLFLVLLLLFLIFMADQGSLLILPTIQNLFRAIIIYFLLTNYGNIVNALKKLGSGDITKEPDGKPGKVGK